jgi:hypothetical protein
MAPKAAVNSQQHVLVVARDHAHRAAARARRRLTAASCQPAPTFAQAVWERPRAVDERAPPTPGSAALGTLAFWSGRSQEQSHMAVLAPPKDVLYAPTTPAFWVTFGRERSRFAQAFAPPAAS